MRARDLIVGAGAVLAPLAANAAGDGDAELSHFVWEWVNFVILLVVLYLVGRKPLRAYMSERRSGVASDLDGAAKVLRDAELRLAEWSEKANGLEAEVADIKRKAQASAEVERERIVTDARAAAERIRSEARRAVERETLRARVALREEAADLAVELATRILKEHVGDADRERLVDEFVTHVERSSDGSRS
jgi:F-type H+-transporting ATPase subunit b